jgi:hypothetical protein
MCNTNIRKMSHISVEKEKKDEFLEIFELDDCNKSSVETETNFSRQSEDLASEEDCKIPLWFANRKKDILTAEHWIESVERAKILYNWDDETTIFYVCTALRDGARTWFSMLERDGIDCTSWEQIKNEFLESYGTIFQEPEISPDVRQGREFLYNSGSLFK